MSNTETRNSRPDVRPMPKPEDARAAAARRAQEIREGGFVFDGNVDDFATPAPPELWIYEWKRETIMNQEDRSNMAECLRTGWTAVPVERHPEMMQAGAVGAIRKKGMILMERPKEINDEVKQLAVAAARNEIKIKAGQTNGQGLLGREDAKVSPKTSRSYEPMQIPDK
jgi:hypothetical protein